MLNASGPCYGRREVLDRMKHGRIGKDGYEYQSDYDNRIVKITKDVNDTQKPYLAGHCISGAWLTRPGLGRPRPRWAQALING